jgi:GTP-binding protein
MQAGQPISLVKRNGEVVRTKIKDLLVFEGLEKNSVERVECGDI